MLRNWISCVLLGAIACAGPRDAPPAETSTGTAPGTSARAAAEKADPVFGKWVITGHRIPGVSAMTDGEARTWRGRVIELSANSAATGPDACATPTYETVTVPADSLLGTDFHLHAASLGLTPGGTIDVTTVSCSGSQWSAPGGVLIHTGANRAFTFWDGVFFELERS